MPNKASLLTQLKCLVQEIDDCCPPCPPCCPPPPQEPCPPCCPKEEPFAQVCFTCPPYGPLPTVPTPVKPLQMPCIPGPGPTPEALAEKERLNPSSRYDNYYNNYNVDYHQAAMSDPKGTPPPIRCPPPNHKQCEDYTKLKRDDTSHYNRGCPTGFKPCQMRLCPPPCCNPLGVWRAQVLPCPPWAKTKKLGSERKVLPPPECCTRPGCHHWKPEGGPCLYDAPCRASCFNHPPGMKPSGKAACTLPPHMCPD